jgi:hypothetical protein
MDRHHALLGARHNIRNRGGREGTPVLSGIYSAKGEAERAKHSQGPQQYYRTRTAYRVSKETQVLLVAHIQANTRETSKPLREWEGNAVLPSAVCKQTSTNASWRVGADDGAIHHIDTTCSRNIPTTQ